MKKIKNIYIHIPFCKRKCSFCDFAIYAIGNSEPVSPHFFDISDVYVNNLIQEINFIGSSYQINFNKLKSIYIGGGTPTLLNIDQLERIFNALRNNFKWEETAEISIESDPNTFNREKLSLLRKLRINRITMGVQSLDSAVFKSLNRSHSLDETVKSIEIIKESDFSENFGVDLIQGLPLQNISSIEKDLEILTKIYNIPHISIYMLSLEPKSSLFSKYQKEYNSKTKNDEVADMFIRTHYYMQEMNYDHYEISSFCIDKKQSIHNKSYWDGFSNFYGFGNSASSYCFMNRRFKKPLSIIKYYDFVGKLMQKNFFEEYLEKNNENKDCQEYDIDNDFTDNSNHLSTVELKFLLLNQIRRREGINLSDIKRGNFHLYKIIYEYLKKKLDLLPNLLQYHQIDNDDHVRLIFPEGILISDEILVELFNLL